MAEHYALARSAAALYLLVAEARIGAAFLCVGCSGECPAADYATKLKFPKLILPMAWRPWEAFGLSAMLPLWMIR